MEHKSCFLPEPFQDVRRHKLQIAMYEQFGIPGLMAYKRTVDYCKEKDLVVIGDI